MIRLLQREGYTVDAPPIFMRSLSGDSAYLASYLSKISGPVVLVGHSYGGAVITNAATGNADVKALVYVDAFLPAQGENLTQLVGAQSCLAGTQVDPTKVFGFVQDPSLPVGGLRRLRTGPSHVALPRIRAVLRRRLPRKRGRCAGSDTAAHHLGSAHRPVRGTGLEDDPFVGPDRHRRPAHPRGPANDDGYSGRCAHR